MDQQTQEKPAIVCSGRLQISSKLECRFQRTLAGNEGFPSRVRFFFEKIREIGEKQVL
jgi:hypothetical protein